MHGATSILDGLVQLTLQCHGVTIDTLKLNLPPKIARLGRQLHPTANVIAFISQPYPKWILWKQVGIMMKRR